MSQEIVLEKFQGPLGLLLQLIEQGELKISEISLATVTEQFFDHLQTVEKNRPDELADFLVIATKLVYLKSRQLLPYLHPEVDEGPSLAEQLKLYQLYAEASHHVEGLWNRHQVGYGRIEPVKLPNGFMAPGSAAIPELYNVFRLLLKRLEPRQALPEVTVDHRASVAEAFKNIHQRLTELKRLSWGDMLKNTKSRTDVIVHFLALLELLKQQKVFINQATAFADMVIERT